MSIECGDDEEPQSQNEESKRSDSCKKQTLTLTLTDIKTYLSEDVVYTAFTYIFFIYCAVTVISFGIILADPDSHTYSKIALYVYYAGELFFHICVIIVSYLSVKNTLQANIPLGAATWYEIVFYVKFTFCSLFNFISFILLCIGVVKNYDKNKYKYDITTFILMAIAYFMSIFSIPFPGIVLFKFDHLKKVTAGRYTNKSAALSNNTYTNKFFKSASVGTKDSTSLLSNSNSKVYNKTTLSTGNSKFRSMSLNSDGLVTNLTVRKNHFFEKEMMAAMCSVYGINFVVYLLIPSIGKDSFDERIQLMYDGLGSFETFIYSINHLILRTFYGMCLNGLFFAFFAMVVARDQETYYVKDQNKLSDFQLVMKLLRKQWKYSVFVIVLISATVLPDVCKYFNRSEYTFSDVSQIICYVWIAINLFGVCVSIRYKYLFAGAYRKYSQRKLSRFGNENGGKKVDNIPYGLKAALLFILFMVQLILIFNDDDDHLWSWLRMISMLALSVIQFFTFPLLRKMQINDEYCKWYEKYNREFWLKWIYFRFLIIVNAVNLAYVYIFSRQYYEMDKLDHGDNDKIDKLRVSYALSFAGAAIFTMSLSQLVMSYAEFDHLRGENSRKLEMTLKDESVIME